MEQMEQNENRLRQEILDEAARRAERIVARAKSAADADFRKAEADTAGMREKQRQQALAEAAAMKSEAALATQEEIRNRWLRMREECIAAAIQGALADAEALPAGDARRMASLAVLIPAAVASVARREVVVRISPADMPFITDEWLKLHLPENAVAIRQDDGIRAGAVAESTDGRMACDNTLSGRTQRDYGRLRRIIAEKITSTGH